MAEAKKMKTLTPLERMTELTRRLVLVPRAEATRKGKPKKRKRH